jgi:hypothetical protein
MRRVWKSCVSSLRDLVLRCRGRSPSVHIAAFSRKKSRFSGKNRLKRVRLICCWSTSTCEKSVL